MQLFKCKLKMAFQALKWFEIAANGSRAPPVSGLLLLLPLHQARLN